MRARTLAALVAIISGLGGTARAADDVTGTWLTASGKTHVKIAPCGGAMCGDIVWVDGNTLDAYNPDPAKRTRSIKGVRVLIDMKPSATPGKYDGAAYNTADGKTYTGSIRATGPDTLDLQGCVMSVFCKTQSWTRVK
jgi:uncharacterized protein (DUF2147 family)